MHISILIIAPFHAKATIATASIALPTSPDRSPDARSPQKTIATVSIAPAPFRTANFSAFLLRKKPSQQFRSHHHLRPNPPQAAIKSGGRQPAVGTKRICNGASFSRSEYVRAPRGAYAPRSWLHVRMSLQIRASRQRVRIFSHGWLTSAAPGGWRCDDSQNRRL